ncbi:hypothetical protein JKP88DRAFT_167163 [Tribonema minus]|uniref:Nop domain-containing protein n=1 Tax=Tribonema minus TaxID=303371 RepID=A0A835YZD1_9STRA|nr:hypothetical protein JKP88DRAFT_167163 [Tribonema minus]
MLALFETPAGYALFKIADEGKVQESKDLAKEFETPEKAAKMVKLLAFSAFEDTASAVAAAADMIEGKMGKASAKFLTKNMVKKELKDKLAVADSKLGGVIKDKLEIKCINDSGVMELMRGIRLQLDGLLVGVGEQNLKAMRLGLSHSLSRYKLKFSADKVDTMIVQAIGLLDELDKEINTYAMRVREWYGWHFPEMAKILNDNMHYAKCVLRMGTRDRCRAHDFSDIIGDDAIEHTLKENAEISMGTEITEMDLKSISALAEQVVALSEYRIQLYDYLKNRMAAIAPNLTILVGELVGARLIAHAGSLLNLAKHPASTIQILGAEKALFRALKTKHDTPKYGLIYHASLIGQTAPKNKGKVSRVLAAKTALAVRVDAMGETTDTTLGLESRAKVEARIRQLEGGTRLATAGAKTPVGVKKYDPKAAKATGTNGAAPPVYNEAEDMVVEAEPSAKKEKKAKKVSVAAR